MTLEERKAKYEEVLPDKYAAVAYSLRKYKEAEKLGEKSNIWFWKTMFETDRQELAEMEDRYLKVCEELFETTRRAAM